MKNGKRKSKLIPFLFLLLFLVSCNEKGGVESISSSSSFSAATTEKQNEKREWKQFKAEIELSQKISNSYQLFLKGSWDNYQNSTKLVKKSEFIYEADVIADVDSETTYDYYVLINDDENYSEHILKKRDNQIRFSSEIDEICLSHKVMDFDDCPVVENQWKILNGPTSNVTETENGIKIQNYTWLSGFVCKENILGEKDYTISAHFKGTKTSPYTDETYIGLVPYYFDSQNYLFAYVQWCNWDGYQSMIREIGFTGYIDGKSAGWNDIFNTSNVTTTPLTGFTLTIIRTGNSFQTTFLGDDKQTFSGSRSFTSLKKGSDYLGLYVQNDTVEVTDYQVKEK